MLVSRRFFFFGSLALPALAAKKPAPERPNLLLILVDGLPAWVLGCYGNKEILTPHLDRLAQAGTRFLNHIAATPAPALSRATILTGRTPMQLHDGENPPAGAALDKVLGDAGYATHAAEPGAAAQFLDRQAAGKPFFLVAGYPELRPPYGDVAQKYRDQYASTRFDSLDLQRKPAPNARAGKEMLADVVASVRQYAAAVSAFDAEVGALVMKLSQRGFLENTLLVFTSSCGAFLGRRGLWDAGDASDPVNVYEEAVATPLMWSWPGRVPTQAARPELVSTYDFVPAICDVLGIDPPSENLCGRSYALLATGKPLPKKQPWRTIVYGHYQTADMARGNRYKLILHGAGGELYDLREDPRETANQYENLQFLTIRNTLSQGLANWKQRYSA